MRSRNIKPGLFKNEELAECHPLGRFLFTGLWCYADRAGRFEWRPKKIKAEVLPYDDDILIEDLLNQLIEKGFLLKYSVNGCDYGQVINFTKHQHPHINEPNSNLPDPEKYDTSTVQEPEEYGSNPSDSLITDSLIPDSKEAAPLADHQKNKNAFNHLSENEYKNVVNLAGSNLNDWFKFFGKAQKNFKQPIPFPLIDRVIRSAITKKSKGEEFNPWAYLNKIIKNELPMANEQENTRKAQEKDQGMKRDLADILESVKGKNQKARKEKTNAKTNA